MEKITRFELIIDEKRKEVIKINDINNCLELTQIVKTIEYDLQDNNQTLKVFVHNVFIGSNTICAICQGLIGSNIFVSKLNYQNNNNFYHYHCYQTLNKRK